MPYMAARLHIAFKTLGLSKAPSFPTASQDPWKVKHQGFGKISVVRDQTWLLTYHLTTCSHSSLELIGWLLLWLFVCLFFTDQLFNSVVITSFPTWDLLNLSQMPSLSGSDSTLHFLSFLLLLEKTNFSADPGRERTQHKLKTLLLYYRRERLQSVTKLPLVKHACNPEDY